MAFKEFTQKNIAELLLGTVIGIIIVLLMNLNFNQSIVIIVLSSLIAIILNNLLQVFVPNEKNQRTALIILSLIGGFALIQQFQIGIFAIDNINSQSFINVELQPQASLIELPIVLTGALISGIGKLPFLIGFAVVLAILIMNPATAIFGWILLAIIGIPAIIILGVGTFLIAKNFTLILILIGGYSILSLLFKTQVKKQALK